LSKNGSQRRHTQAEDARQRRHFSEIARNASIALGSVWAFLGATAIVVLWLLSGPLFGYSDAWQLVINTGTTIVTFLMVFLIQNTQNRDSRALHLKLDELIRSVHAARNRLIDLENCTDEELDAMQREFEQLKGRKRRGTSNAASQPVSSRR
jgi:low affinity Fe/Cu permease